MCRKLEELHNKKPDYFLNNITAIPIDIGKILEDNNIKYYPVSFKKLEKELQLEQSFILGLAFARGNELGILFSNESDEKEKRFTLAHELGHCCRHMNKKSLYHIELHTKGDVLENRSNKFLVIDSKKEEEADTFARDLLVPTSILLWVLKKHPDINIDQLADCFDIPKDQMVKKLEQIKDSKIRL